MELNIKNKKIKEAGKAGRRAEFWTWVADLAHWVWEHASLKRNAAAIQQSELLNEVYSMDSIVNADKA